MNSSHHRDTWSRRWRDASGQSLLEGAITLPLLILIGFGVFEAGSALRDQQVVARLSREGANLISRGTSLADAAAAIKAMSVGTVDFDTDARLVLSVLKRGATTGTANYNQLVLYQRYEAGAGRGDSRLEMRSGGSFGPAPDYIAVDSDNNAGLQVRNAPPDVATVLGGLVYVTEIITSRHAVTPADQFGIELPDELYAVAYF